MQSSLCRPLKPLERFGLARNDRFLILNNMDVRYSYVDVPLQMALQEEFSKGLTRIIFKYDINCKYNINAFQRCSENQYSPLADHFRTRLKKENGYVHYDVNDFHIRSHIPSCSDEYGSHHRPLMGIRACEEVESIWAIMNKFQWLTREMDVGA